MDQPSSAIKQTECSKDQFYLLDFLDLSETSQCSRMCSFCIQKKIPYQQCEIYPPFKNQNIRELIKQYCNINVQKSNIDSFFLKLRKDIEDAVQLAENEAKQQFIHNEDTQQNFMKKLSEIFETDKLRQLLISGSEDLNIFLQDKWKNADQNEKMTLKLIDQMKLSRSLVNFEKKENEVNSLIQSLKKFRFLDKFRISSIKNTILIKSDIGYSSQFTTIKTDDQNYLQLINSTPINYVGQAFLDFILDPKKRYTIRLNYQHQYKQSCYFFGLFNNYFEKSYYCYNQLSYSNGYVNWGIDQFLKVPILNQYKSINQKEEFEVRICLDDKILKVASFPKYESVLELSDQKRIESGEQYRFYVSIFQSGDIIEITEVIESDDFENNEF